jgi:hypothetical protein
MFFVDVNFKGEVDWCRQFGSLQVYGCSSKFDGGVFSIL